MIPMPSSPSFSQVSIHERYHVLEPLLLSKWDPTYLLFPLLQWQQISTLPQRHHRQTHARLSFALPSSPWQTVLALIVSPHSRQHVLALRLQTRCARSLTMPIRIYSRDLADCLVVPGCTRACIYCCRSRLSLLQGKDPRAWS